ncbi:MAG: right-handed parallel beta-helix repeat-containing protein [Oscillochloridaceae bacterium umkhey_bin13]
MIILLVLGLIGNPLSVGYAAPAAQPPANCSVFGVLREDVTWEPAQCDPYIVTGNLMVPEGVILTIRPGTTVRVDKGFGIQVEGALVAHGLPTDPIIFTSNQAQPTNTDWSGIDFADSSVDAVFDEAGTYVTGSILRHVVIEYAAGGGVIPNGAVRIDRSAPYIDYSIFRNNGYGGVYGWINGELYITNNLFTANHLMAIDVSGNGTLHATGNVITGNNPPRAIRFIAIDAEVDEAIIRQNRITENSGMNLGGLRIQAKTITISNNLIARNIGSAIAVRSLVEQSVASITGNHIVDNAREAERRGMPGGAIQIRQIQRIELRGNQIVGNTNDDPPQPANLIADHDSSGLARIDATDNYWGTTDASEIERSIWHFVDDAQRVEVTYEPFRDAPIPLPVTGPALVLHGLYYDAAPGSAIWYGGAGFPPNNMVALSINNQPLGEIQADANGHVSLNLLTDQIGVGRYTIRATPRDGDQSASTTLVLSVDAPPRTREENARTLTAPAQAAPSPTPTLTAVPTLAVPTATSVPTPRPAMCGVSGLISSDTTWRPDQCDPYVVTGNIRINQGATLTILPGTVIAFEPQNQLEVAGKLIARGTADERIVFTRDAQSDGMWSGIIFQDTSADAVFDTQARYTGGSILQYVTIEHVWGTALRLDQASPFVDHAIFRAIDPLYSSVLSARSGSLLQITNSIFEDNGPANFDGLCEGLMLRGAIINVEGFFLNITGNTFSENCIGVIMSVTAENEAVISNNTVRDNNAEILISTKAQGFPLTISGNLITENRCLSAAIIEEDVAFRANTITDNELIPGPSIQKLFYALVASSTGGDLSKPIDARGNYWGTTDATEIENLVFHYPDDQTRNLVEFEPFLLAPITEPVPMPTFTIMAEASNTQVATPPPDPQATVTPLSDNDDPSPTRMAVEPTAVAAQPSDDSGGAALTIDLRSYLPWVYGGLLGLLGILWTVEIATRRRHIATAIGAAFSSSKWQVRQMKLGGERGSAEKQLAQATVELGRLVWNKRIQHPAYDALFTQLVALDQQRGDASAELTTLDTRILQTTNNIKQVKTDFSGRISTVQERKKAVSVRWNQAKAATQAAEKQLNNIQGQQQQASNEIQNLRRRLDQLQTSTAPDRDTQMATITGSILELEQAITNMAGFESAARAEVDRLQAEQAPVDAEITTLDQQIAQLQQEQQQEITPLERRRDELQAQRRQANETVTALVVRIDGIMSDLGAQASQARPNDPALNDLFSRIDQLQQRLTELSTNITILNARRQGLDRASLRTFYMLLFALIGTLGAVAAAVVWLR